MKRVLVCGGRDYGKLDPKKVLDHPRRRAERRKLEAAMLALLAEVGQFVLIHGGARGADALSAGWAADNLSVKPLVFEAKWQDISRPGAVVKHRKNDGVAYDALAGHHRNQRMVDEGKPDLVVAFPGGTGTADMVDRARKANIEVREIV